MLYKEAVQKKLKNYSFYNLESCTEIFKTIN